MNPNLPNEIDLNTKSITDKNFEIETVSYIPKFYDSKLTLSNSGLLFDATVLFIDMRGSTKVLNNHNKSSVAKIHMCYFLAILEIAKSLNGEVRSFNGDSMLVFFQGINKTTTNKAVKSALQMVHTLITITNKHTKKYSEIDFGIGIAQGAVLCTKIGIKGNRNDQDLIWIGNPVNKAAKMGDNAKSPHYISVSERVYDMLDEDLKYVEKPGLFWGTYNEELWLKEKFLYNHKKIITYYTSHYLPL